MQVTSMPLSTEPYRNRVDEMHVQDTDILTVVSSHPDSQWWPMKQNHHRADFGISGSYLLFDINIKIQVCAISFINKTRRPVPGGKAYLKLHLAIIWKNKKSQMPTDLDQHRMQKEGISGTRRTRLKPSVENFNTKFLSSMSLRVLGLHWTKLWTGQRSNLTFLTAC